MKIAILVVIVVTFIVGIIGIYSPETLMKSGVIKKLLFNPSVEGKRAEAEKTMKFGKTILLVAAEVIGIYICFKFI